MTVLITGANRGIGLALARAYTGAGESVVATCRNLGDADELKDTGATVLRLDVTDGESVDALASQIGDTPIDLLINNAGVGSRGGFGKLDYDNWAHVMAVNTFGPLRVMEALVDNVAASNGKMIANISSQMGSIGETSASFGLIYRTSKAALNMALKAASFDLADRDITLLTLHPGWVQTDMGGDQAPVSPDESAAGLKKVIADAGPSKDLRFIDYQGREIPW